MQQLQDQVTRQQQQMQQLQRQLADTEAANAALRNIICAIKGQPPCNISTAASPPQQQQDVPAARNSPPAHAGAPKALALLSPASVPPLGHNTVSAAVIPPQIPQQQQLQLQDTLLHPQLQHALSDSAAAAAAVTAGVGSVELLRRSCSSVAASAAVGASPTAAAAMHFAQANPFRRKSSSTVAALAGLLPIAQRMASDTGPADTSLQVLQQMQQQQWQASADQSVLAAAASAANAAEAAAAAAASHGPSSNRSSTSMNGWDALLRTDAGGIGSANSNREDAQIRRRQLLLLLAQRDSGKKAGDLKGKPQPVGSAGGAQQQQSVAMSLPQGYHQFRIPEQYTGTTAGPANDLPLATQLNSIAHTSNQNVVGTSAAQVLGSATTVPGQSGAQQSTPQQMLLSDLFDMTSPATQSSWGHAPAPVQQQSNGIRGFADLSGPGSGSGCGSASLGFGRAPSDGLFRLSSTDVMLTDLLTDMA